MGEICLSFLRKIWGFIVIYFIFGVKRTRFGQCLFYIMQIRYIISPVSTNAISRKFLVPTLVVVKVILKVILCAAFVFVLATLLC